MPEAIYTARPLTDEEKIFAEKNHNLMYRYIRIHELDLEDWYDILIIPYLQAVKKYFTYEHLQKYKFEQIFFRTLDSARSNYWRAMNRKMRCPSGGIYSYENLVCKRERDDLTGLECAENILLLSNPNNDRGRSTCAWNAESSCGIVDRHTKRNTFITGER